MILEKNICEHSNLFIRCIKQYRGVCAKATRRVIVALQQRNDELANEVIKRFDSNFTTEMDACKVGTRKIITTSENPIFQRT